ncbi:Uncharacterised protein [Staphylococcus aureus]|nr:Uncharacterised protein [Staphylococcus aureus]CUD52879.1 Uncharacterised protein [Staphylococcus aureus]CUD53986.1 Uncharacterised protein [Staphylococcus aureus]
MISSFDSPLLIISPVNGFFSVGVVIVFSPFCPSLVTFSVPGAKSGLNLRSFSNGISSFDSPLLIISPVNGFFSVGVVIVFSPFCPSLVTFSVPGAKSGLNLRSFSNGISSFSTIESPFTGPYFVTLSTGGLTTSPVSGFLIPGLPGTSSFSPVGNFGSNSSR